MHGLTEHTLRSFRSSVHVSGSGLHFACLPSCLLEDYQDANAVLHVRNCAYVLSDVSMKRLRASSAQA
jgi:hypothetical protein